VASALPEPVWTSAEVEARVVAASPRGVVPPGVVQLMTGVKERRFAPPGVYNSDLAAQAARAVLARTATPPERVDLLIYAAAGQDLMEPATANIVQEKTGTRAAVFDLKNACNSFLNGLQVAESLILSGAYRCVLVATGEANASAIRWDAPTRHDLRLNFPGYTLGDAGGAALVVADHAGGGIFYRDFATVSRYWDVATLPGGGSMHPRGDAYTYLRGDGSRLKEAFARLGPGLLHRALQATGTTFAEYSRILVHQVTMPFLRAFVSATGVPQEKIELTLPHLGNMAAATLPVGYAQAERRGAIRPGDRVMWIGLAGGISVGVMLQQV
jgi:3-oxoacyl-[acyl-carrier-protein] synthase-3